MKRLLIIAMLALLSCRRGDATLFRPQSPDFRTLPNGITMFFIEDREFPTVQMFFYIRGGSVHDPKGKEGLASLAMQALRQGGSVRRSADEIDEVLDFSGINLEMAASQEFESLQLSLHKKDLDQALSILFDLLKEPAFDPSRFEIVKSRMQEALKREEEDPLTVGYREFPGFIYGPDASWGRKSSVASLGRIGRDDVVGFFNRQITPDKIVVAASGDLSADELRDKLQQKTMGWAPVPTELPPIPALAATDGKDGRILSKPGLTQSTILIGHLGESRDNPDKFALLVMNYILGGGGSLTSRLGEEIRSSSGKAYGVWSDFGFGRDRGIFRAVAQTALGNTAWVARKMAEMIRETAHHPQFSEEEIRRARESILRSLFFDFETRFSQVKQLAQFYLWGYPADYLDVFQKNIRSVSCKDLERVAATYLKPDVLKMLVVTDGEALGAQMESLKP